MKRVLTLLVAWFLTLIVAPDASALVEYEGENSAFNLRLAIDAGGGANFNPNPDQLYPSDQEAIVFAGLRVLFDSFLGEHLRIEFNGYQNGYTLLDSEALISGLALPYRSKYLNHDWLNSDKGKMVAAIDKLSLKIFAGPVNITIGRQPIGLSNNFIFTPNDFFYPFGSTAVDREFRHGVDAFRLDAGIGDLSRIDVFAVMGYDSEGRLPQLDQSAFLVRMAINSNGVDWSIMLGKLAGRYVNGFSMSDDLGFMGIRTEANVSFYKEDYSKPEFSVAAGVDKRFENTLHIMLEYYWHQKGETDPSRYLESKLQSYDMADPFLGEHYLGLSMNGELLPVLVMQGTVIVNLTDPSMILSPGLTWSAEEEVDFIISATIPVGQWAKSGSVMPEVKSEYGMYPFSIQLQGRWYF